MSLILTDEQIKADRDDRIASFKKGLIELETSTKIGMRPQIHPSGPINILIDLKNDTHTTTE